MAMGKSAFKLPPHIELERQRSSVKSQENHAKEWPHRWGWLLDEYQILRDRLEEISLRSVIIKKKVRTDLRSIFPVPETHNHYYGWLASKPEFQLEKYGPDIIKPEPIEELDKVLFT